MYGAIIIAFNLSFSFLILIRWSNMSTRTFLVFIDGLGWGEPDSKTNPQYTYGGDLLRLPVSAAGEAVPVANAGWAKPIDAVLGVVGVPQSATGQTTLLSGVSGQEALGKHLTGFPNEKLREILLEHSILKTLNDRGYQAGFLNAFRPRFWELSRERQLTLSATTVATLAADLPFLGLDDIRAGRAVYQEMTNTELNERGFEMELMAPREAGQIAGRVAREKDFLLYEYFQTDKAGHSGEMARSEVELHRVDEFLQGLLAELATELADETLVVLTSDHGNLEDGTTRRHTTNPIPLMAWGKRAREFVSGVDRLDQVTPRILTRHPAL